MNNMITVMRPSKRPYYFKSERTLTIKWNGNTYTDSNRGPKVEVHRNIKTLEAALKVVHKRNTQNMRSAIWNSTPLI